MQCDFLRNRKQRVLLNGEISDCSDVDVAVPQGSILGPLLFLIYINDVSEELYSNAKLFADDTSLYVLQEYRYDVHFLRCHTFGAIHSANGEGVC